jgi:hypothetical protein
VPLDAITGGDVDGAAVREVELLGLRTSRKAEGGQQSQ